MGCGTGPWVLFGPTDHASPYRIPFHITDGLPKMRVVENTCEKSILPQMTGELILLIEVRCIHPVDSMHSFGEPELCCGVNDQMKVILHEAIRADFDTVFWGMFLYEREKELPILWV
jgi:hypothetical protein